jgi:hypothetical protein
MNGNTKQGKESGGAEEIVAENYEMLFQEEHADVAGESVAADSEMLFEQGHAGPAEVAAAEEAVTKQQTEGMPVDKISDKVMNQQEKEVAAAEDSIAEDSEMLFDQPQVGIMNPPTAPVIHNEPATTSQPPGGAKVKQQTRSSSGTTNPSRTTSNTTDITEYTSQSGQSTDAGAGGEKREKRDRSDSSEEEQPPKKKADMEN